LKILSCPFAQGREVDTQIQSPANGSPLFPAVLIKEAVSFQITIWHLFQESDGCTVCAYFWNFYCIGLCVCYCAVPRCCVIVAL
jgi:hypothetical protein